MIPKTVAIITGDLINSTNLTVEQKNKLIRELNTALHDNACIILPLKFYRGDSFQLMCTKEKAFELAIYIQSVILAIAETFARISIGIGSTSRIEGNNVLLSEGEAFTLSGQQLDIMKQEARLIKIAINNSKLQSIFEITALLIETIIEDWKQGQAAVVSETIKGIAQKEVAKTLGISIAAVSKALKTAKWKAIKNFLDWFENQTSKIK